MLMLLLVLYRVSVVGILGDTTGKPQLRKGLESEKILQYIYVGCYSGKLRPKKVNRIT